MNKTYKEFAVSLAKKAGKIMLKNFTLGMNKEWKSDNSPVTEADIAINTLIIETIKKAYPEHSIISEEGSFEVQGSEFSWVCDPIDGTLPFSHGLPTFAFSLALVHQGISILGLVYDPILERLFIAEKGKGAFLNGDKIYVSTHKGLQHTLVGFPSWKGAPYELPKFRDILQEHKVKMLNVHSTVYMGAMTACGQFIATIHPGHRSWDIAALKVIIEEAGGKVTNLFGEEQRYDKNIKGALMTNGLVHDQILDLIQQTIQHTPHEFH